MTRITTTLNTYGDLLESADLRVADCGPYGTSIKIGIVPEGREARKVFQGPMVPGPWAFTNALPVIIDGKGPERIAAQEHVLLGEELEIDGLPGVWTLRRPRMLEGDAPQLERVR